MEHSRIRDRGRGLSRSGERRVELREKLAVLQAARLRRSDCNERQRVCGVERNRRTVPSAGDGETWRESGAGGESIERGIGQIPEGRADRGRTGARKVAARGELCP